jgi:nicotinamidase/pyrazinamidase
MRALLAVDVQNDFMTGSLAVPDGSAVIEPLLIAASRCDFIVASRDWHPYDHCSFVDQGGIWPVHCVAYSDGAVLAPEIRHRADLIISKATTPDVDAYSAFDGTDLAERLRSEYVDQLVIGGLATDYCVRASVLDALEAGFQARVLVDAIRAVDITDGDGARALAEMQVAGAELITVAELQQVSV